MIYIAHQCGLSLENALYGVPVDFLNDLIGCYWVAQGMDVETPHEVRQRKEKAQAEFKRLTNTKHNFNEIDSWA